MAVRKQTAALLALAVCGSFGLAACNDSKDAEGQQTTPTTVKPVDDAGVSPKDLTTPPVLKEGFAGARKDVEIEECKDFALGDKSIKGSVTNPDKEAKDYLVIVNWVHGSDVMGRGFAALRGVKPGEKTEFKVDAKLAKAADGCTVNVTKGSLP